MGQFDIMMPESDHSPSGPSSWFVIGTIVVIAAVITSLAFALSRKPDSTGAAPSVVPADVPVSCDFLAVPDGPSLIDGQPTDWVLRDATGLVTACRVSAIEPVPLLPDASTVFVENALGDDTTLRLRWLETACSDRGWISVRTVGGLLQIAVVAEAAEARVCPAVGLSYEAELRLNEDVDVTFVRARHDLVDPETMSP